MPPLLLSGLALHTAGVPKMEQMRIVPLPMFMISGLALLMILSAAVLMLIFRYLARRQGRRQPRAISDATMPFKERRWCHTAPFTRIAREILINTFARHMTFNAKALYHFVASADARAIIWFLASPDWPPALFAKSMPKGRRWGAERDAKKIRFEARANVRLTLCNT